MTLDDDLGWMEECEKDYDYFHSNREDLYIKYKKDFVAVKSLKVYRDASPLRLQELLRAEGVDDTNHAFIQFVK